MFQNRMLFVTGTKGGVEHKKAWGWNTTTFLKLFCFLVFVSLQSASRLPIEKNQGKTIATPPERGVPTGPDSGKVEHAPIPAPGGRYRRYLSLREGSEKTPRSGVD